MGKESGFVGEMRAKRQDPQLLVMPLTNYVTMLFSLLWNFLFSCLKYWHEIKKTSRVLSGSSFWNRKFHVVNKSGLGMDLGCELRHTKGT